MIEQGDVAVVVGIRRGVAWRRRGIREIKSVRGEMTGKLRLKSEYGKRISTGQMLHVQIVQSA